MALTDAEEARLAALEVLLNRVQIVVKQLAAKEQIRQLTLLKQREIELLTTRVEALERIVTLLENALL